MYINLQKLKRDFEIAKSERAGWESYIRRMRRTYVGDAKEPKGNRSNYVSKEAKKAVIWMKPSIKNPFVNNAKIINAEPIGIGDEPIARQSEILINYFHSKKFRKDKFYDKLAFNLLVDGLVVVKTGWEYEEIEKEVDVDIIDEKTGMNVGKKKAVVPVPIRNHPTAIVCRNEDIYIDPSANEIDEAEYIIHKREVSISQLKKEGIYKNLDKIKYEESDSYFNNDDSPRKKVVMYEYWGKYDIDNDGILEPIVCCWIGDTIVREEENPFPDGEPPFVINGFERSPTTKYPTSLVDLVLDAQIAKTNIMRGMFNDIRNSNANQRGVMKGNLDPMNFRRFIDGKDFEFNHSPNGFYQGNYTPIPTYIFNVLQMVDQEERMFSNMNNEAAIGAQAIYGSQASKSGQLTQSMIRELDIVNSIAENIVKPMLRKWIAYSYEFLEKEDIERITGIPYVEVPAQFVDGRMDFDIAISTEQTDSIKAANLSFLLQTLGNNLPFEMTKKIMAKIAELQKDNELAHEILSYEPQPSEIEMREKMLELKLLEASIMERMSRVKENEADYEVKMAKAKESNAKAQSIDMETIRKRYGLDFKEKIAEKAIGEKLKIDNYANKMAKSVLRGSENIDLKE